MELSSAHEASLVELAEAVRSGATSPVALVDAHIARIEAVNPRLNALVAERFAAARAEAEAAARRVREEPSAALPPLLGVPCTIKEFFAVEGLPQTGGLWSRRQTRPSADATVVARLRAAGAIVLGTTNVPEGGLWLETYNAIHGRTRNPWDARRTSGGSSGGEGALVASGASPLGIGSDIGGSIRIPAAFCGVVGHKPSGRLVPNTGQFPPALGEAGAYLGTGPLVRRVRDVMPVLRVISGADGVDPVCVGGTLGDPAGVALRAVRVVPVPSNGRVRVRPVMTDAVRRSALALKLVGATVEERAFPGMARAVEIWSAMLAAGSSVRYDAVLGDGVPIRLGRELAKLSVGRSRHTFAGLVLASLDAVGHRFPGLLAGFAEEGPRLREEIEAALGPDGVMLHPPYSRPAPYHRDPWRTPLDFGCTALFNVLELPVTTVPVGFDPRGLPVAVQVIGCRGRDHVTLAVAQALEDAFGGWRRAEP